MICLREYSTVIYRYQNRELVCNVQLYAVQLGRPGPWAQRHRCGVGGHEARPAARAVISSFRAVINTVP